MVLTFFKFSPCWSPPSSIPLSSIILFEYIQNTQRCIPRIFSPKELKKNFNSQKLNKLPKYLEQNTTLLKSAAGSKWFRREYLQKHVPNLNSAWHLLWRMCKEIGKINNLFIHDVAYRMKENLDELECYLLCSISEKK